MDKKKKEFIKKSLSLFLGLMCWYAVIQITISNLIVNVLFNFIVTAILILISIILIAFAFSPKN